MGTKAYILIETAVGKSRAVAARLRTLEGVETVDPVTGPYDIIAVVTGKDLSAVGELVTDDIHSVHGIRRTITCLCIGTTD